MRPARWPPPTPISPVIEHGVPDVEGVRVMRARIAAEMVLERLGGRYNMELRA